MFVCVDVCACALQKPSVHSELAWVKEQRWASDGIWGVTSTLFSFLDQCLSFPPPSFIFSLPLSTLLIWTHWINVSNRIPLQLLFFRSFIWFLPLSYYHLKKRQLGVITLCLFWLSSFHYWVFVAQRFHQPQPAAYSSQLCPSIWEEISNTHALYRSWGSLSVRAKVWIRFMPYRLQITHLHQPSSYMQVDKTQSRPKLKL